MGDIMTTIIAFCEQDDWPHTVVEDPPMVRTGFSGDNGEFTCYLIAREEQFQVGCYSMCAGKAPPDKRREMAEFIAWANYGLPVGNLEMDMTDGEVRFRTSIDVEGDELSVALVRNLVHANVTLMDRFWPGLMAVLYTDTSARDAYAKTKEF